MLFRSGFARLTSSIIEASVVLALLDSQGIAGFRISGNPQAILPMSMSPLGEIRIAVPEDAAGPAAAQVPPSSDVTLSEDEDDEDEDDVYETDSEYGSSDEENN